MPLCKVCGKKTGLFSVKRPDKTYLCLSCAKKEKHKPRSKRQIAVLVAINLGIVITSIYGFIITFQAIQGSRSFNEELLFPVGVVILLIVLKTFYDSSKRRS
jgi:hypothetical protein